MKSINSNQTQLKTLFFGLLCLLAGVVCFAKGYSNRLIDSSAVASFASGERQGVSPSPVKVCRDWELLVFEQLCLLRKIRSLS